MQGSVDIFLKTSKRVRNEVIGFPTYHMFISLKFLQILKDDDIISRELCSVAHKSNKNITNLVQNRHQTTFFIEMI